MDKNTPISPNPNRTTLLRSSTSSHWSSFIPQIMDDNWLRPGLDHRDSPVVRLGGCEMMGQWPKGKILCLMLIDVGCGFQSQFLVKHTIWYVEYTFKLKQSFPQIKGCDSSKQDLWNHKSRIWWFGHLLHQKYDVESEPFCWNAQNCELPRSWKFSPAYGRAQACERKEFLGINIKQRNSYGKICVRPCFIPFYQKRMGPNNAMKGLVQINYPFHQGGLWFSDFSSSSWEYTWMKTTWSKTERIRVWPDHHMAGQKMYKISFDEVKIQKYVQKGQLCQEHHGNVLPWDVQPPGT